MIISTLKNNEKHLRILPQEPLRYEEDENAVRAERSETD